MQLQDTFKVTGNVVLRRYDENGVLNLEREHKNLVVTAGKQLIASRLAADTRPAIATTFVSGNGVTATVTYAAQPAAPYEVGSYIKITGVIPATFNGTHRVNTVSTTQVTFDSIIVDTMTTAGNINSLFNGTVKTMRIGASNTVANLSDTSLISDIVGVSIFSSKVDVSDETASVTYIALFPAGTGTTGGVTGIAGITEAAMVNENNKMLCRTVFPLVTKAVGESLEIFWTVTIN
jgi:hypothetical protein